MSSSPSRNATHGQLDSWRPSTSRQLPPLDDDNSTDDDEFEMALVRRNPLTYFLTPSTPVDEDDMEFDFDFDAGIEDSNNPREIVRSISPSTLDGLKSYKPKSKAEETCAIIDDGEDDDDEDYIRFRSNKSLPDFGCDRPVAVSGTQSRSRSMEALLSPSAFHIGSPRGRPQKRFSPPQRPLLARNLQRRHSWREPSPDVWIIEEEPEKETMSEMGFSVEDLFAEDREKTRPINIPAAKPKKRVRFVLPSAE